MCRPTLASDGMTWPILQNYAPSCLATKASNRHDYAHARAYLASLTVDMVKSFFLFSFIFSFLFLILNSTGGMGSMEAMAA